VYLFLSHVENLKVMSGPMAFVLTAHRPCI